MSLMKLARYVHCITQLLIHSFMSATAIASQAT